MYYFAVVACMFVLPLLSVAAELTVTYSLRRGPPMQVVRVLGGRLAPVLAGVSQIAQPQYTAQTILGIDNAESQILVRELGFANVAIGLLGVVSLRMPAWQLAAALTGGVFYALAGTNHVLHASRNRLQNLAMLSDLFVAVILLGACIGTGISR